MKKLIIALLLSLFPIYKLVTWIIIFNQPIYTTQAERVAAYHKNYFFDLEMNESYLTLLRVLLVLVSIYLVSKAELSKKYNFIKNIFLSVLAFLGIYHFWSLL